MVGCMDRYRAYRWMDGWIDGLMDRLRDGLMDEWMCE